MSDPKAVLLGLLGALAVLFTVAWTRRLRRPPVTGAEPGTGAGPPSGAAVSIGAGTNFFDTLGVGSFAPTASLFRLLGVVPDRLIPGTMNVGHALPSVA